LSIKALRAFPDHAVRDRLLRAFFDQAVPEGLFRVGGREIDSIFQVFTLRCALCITNVWFLIAPRRL